MDFIHLLERFMRGETGPEEEKLLKEWFQSAPARKEIETYYSGRWTAAEGADMDPSRKEEVLARITREIKEREDMPAIPTQRRNSFMRTWLPYAAVFILAFGLGLSALFMQPPGSPLQEFTVSVAKGQRSNLLLPDGTKVWVNSHTEIRYDNEYGIRNRNIVLKGEAFFEVEKNEELPFVVNAEEMDIQVLGTTFNLKAYPEDDEIIATLFTGSIKGVVGDKEFTISPRQHLTYDRLRNVMQVSESENVNYISMWRDNELAFMDETLEEVAKILNRMYNVEVVILSEKIKSYRFSGVIKNNSLDNVIEIISLTAPISYHSTGDTILLNEKR
ncbi:MAG: DUF4974 domain-containing protein [Tannerellaceae bacterium]|nr:DUF4974 domain-containing protein [Tannerellaceae bacterium]